MTGGYETVSDFRQKTTSFFCFVVVGLNCIYHLIKNKSGSNTEPCDTPEFIFIPSEFWPFNTTLCFRSPGQHSNKDSKSPPTP